MGLFNRKRTDDLTTAIEEYQQNVPVQQLGNGKLVVEDVFWITGRGSVVVGTVASGSFHVGDYVEIGTVNGAAFEARASSRITAIELFRKQVEVAQTGDAVGLLLRDIGKNDACKGDIIIRI